MFRVIRRKKQQMSQEEGRLLEIYRLFNQACLMELSIEHVTGKKAIELV